MAPMSLTWTLQHHGWATCVVSDQHAEATVFASYVTGGPEEFLTAVAHLVLGEAVARAEFEAEPTQYRWIFQRTGPDVDIRLLEMASARLPDDAGIVVWSSYQTVDTLARTVVRAFDAVAAEHGNDGYESTWGRPFPSNELNALRAAWRAHRG